MAGILLLILQLLVILFIVRAVLSWVRPQPGSAVYNVASTIDRITEPVLAPVRRMLPPMGGIDLSPLVVIIGIRFLIIPIVQRF
jgi:YggT family protein